MSIRERLVRALVEWRAGDDGSEFMLKVLMTLNSPPKDTREAEFRNVVASQLQQIFGADIVVKREAGVQAKGSKLDLHAHYRHHDYLITMKRGFNQQQFKTVIGEINELRATWRPTVPGARTYCILYPFGMQHAHEFEALSSSFMPLAEESNRQHGDEFFILFAYPFGKTRGRARSR